MASRDPVGPPSSGPFWVSRYWLLVTFVFYLIYFWSPFLSVCSTSHLLCPAKLRLHLLPRPPGSRRLSIQGSFSEQRPNSSNRNILDPKNQIFFFKCSFFFFYSILPTHSWLPAAGLHHMNTSPQPPWRSHLPLRPHPPSSSPLQTLSSCVFLLLKNDDERVAEFRTSSSAPSDTDQHIT